MRADAGALTALLSRTPVGTAVERRQTWSQGGIGNLLLPPVSEGVGISGVEPSGALSDEVYFFGTLLAAYSLSVDSRCVVHSPTGNRTD
jgi:hypothetical protein